MDLKFNKKKKLNLSGSISHCQTASSLVRAAQTFISYNYIKLTYIYAMYSNSRKISYLQVLNGSLLVIFSEYSKVLRKSVLPWLCAVKLARRVSARDSLLILNPFSLRHRNVLRSVTGASSLVLNFR